MTGTATTNEQGTRATPSLAAVLLGLVPMTLLIVFHFPTLIGITPPPPVPFGIIERLAIIAGSLFLLGALLGAAWPEEGWRTGAWCAVPILFIGLPLGYFTAMRPADLITVVLLAVLFTGLAAGGALVGNTLRRRFRPVEA